MHSIAGLMKQVVMVLSTAALCGCAYRVALKDDRGLEAVVKEATTPIPFQVSKENKLPEGFQCFEPMAFLLTAGLIPAHCVETYEVTAPGIEAESTYKVTTMRGWVTFFLMPLPEWHAGLGRNPEAEIKRMANSRN